MKKDVVVTAVNETELLGRIEDEMNSMFKVIVKIFQGSTDVQEILRKRAFIAGGAIRSSVLEEEVNDIDVFLFDEKALNWFESFLFDELGELKLPLAKGWSYKKTINSHNFVNDEGLHPTVQIIHKYVNMPSSLISDFDFKFNMNFFLPSAQYLYIESLEDILNKRIQVNISNCSIVNTFFRFHKFIGKGWTYSGEELADLVILLTSLESIKTHDEVDAQLLMGMSQIKF